MSLYFTFNCKFSSHKGKLFYACSYKKTQCKISRKNISFVMYSIAMTTNDKPIKVQNSNIEIESNYC